jgi:DNA-binding NtrC family response regulator
MKPGKPLRILSVTNDAQLRELRMLVLQSAGYEVFSPATVEEALARIDGGGYHCLVLGHTLTEAECELLTARARSVPTLKVIQVMSAYAPMPALRPDASVDALAGPGVLLEAIREVMGAGDDKASRKRSANRGSGGTGRDPQASGVSVR